MPRCRSLSQPHDPDLSRMLIVYIATGLAFMILPGTFVGVMSLLKISALHTSGGANAGWVQAHGHAQIFGWLGTFILGVGYYTIPRLRLSPYFAGAAWTTWVLWTAGVTMRWASGTWPQLGEWRILFPLGGLFELVAVAVFCVAVYVAKPRTRDDSWRQSVIMITAAGWAMLAAVVFNAWHSLEIARSGDAPLFPFDLNQRYLVLITWGFIVPFVWGFSTRWLPPLLGLRKSRKPLYLPMLGVLFAGVAAGVLGAPLASAILLLTGSLGFIYALRIWEPAEREPKLRGVHASSTFFVRTAYGWLTLAALLAAVAATLPMPNGYSGAGRHALTVGFFSVIVFVIGPRVLPAFFNVRRLWSPRLMAVSLILLTAGCVMRVSSQIFAYEQIFELAWKLLPLSAVVELVAVSLFAFNMLMTLTTGSPLETYLEAQRERAAAAS